MVFAIPCLFVREIARAALGQGCVFGGKDKTGVGSPEGLPLICRFSRLGGFDTLENATQPTRRLAPSRDGEPLSSSPRDAGPCAVFPGKSAGSPPVEKSTGGIIPDETESGNRPARGVFILG